jgi:hypothetical protein
MNRTLTRLATAGLLLFVTACATSSPRSAGTSTSSSRTVLSTEEMQRAGYPDVFTTIQTLRPQWLQLRGSTRFRNNPPAQIKVYLDGSLLGGPELMKQISTKSIFDARYLDGIEASQRWGLDHDMGAIVITTRRS